MGERSLHVHMQERPEPWALDCLDGLLDPRVSMTFGPDLPDEPDYEVLVAGLPTEDELDASTALRALVIPWSGLPQSTHRLLLERRHVDVHNIHHNAAPAAELAMALMLAAAKAVVPVDRDLRADDWSPRYERDLAVLLEGKTAVILGYGAIGSRIARACRGLGMSVTALRRHPERTPAGCPDNVVSQERLVDVLPLADVLFIVVPHTDATRGMLDASRLALLKRECVLVNVARGPIVDEEALFRALESGSIRAAGLDVWYAYPGSEEERHSTPPSRFRFGKLDNVVMSPHRAGAFATREVEEARLSELARSLNAIARGAPAPHPVDVDEGY
jgi:phosphoglycerate dehydrogenase-like enzyme